MCLRHRVDIHIAEYSRKSEKILILEPACRAVLVHLNCELVSLILYKRCYVPLRRREAVLRISHELTVYPHIERLLDTLKGYVGLFSEERLIDIEKCDIRPNRIVLYRRKRRAQILVPLPRVHCIDILTGIIARKLDMSRNLDIRKTAYIIVLLVKIFLPLLRHIGIRKLPDPVKTLSKRHVKPVLRDLLLIK